jgi:hypothetical protein
MGVALSLSIAVNALQVFEIRSAYASLRRAGTVRPEREIVGTHAAPLEVHDLLGRSLTLPPGEPGRTTVIYVFSPRCGWCKRNLANMKALLKGAGPRYNFLPISVDGAGLQQYWTEAGLSGDVYADPSPGTRDAYGLAGTPQTIVIGSDGVVAKDWKGAYTGGLQAEVSSWLDVQLPGLTTVK